MKRPHPLLRRPFGFSLVELMVGIVIAMAAMLVVTQVFRLSEGQRRGITGTDDAQTTAAIGLSLLQRDLNQAGQGLMSTRLLSCTLDLGGGHSVPTLAPVVINPDGIPDGDADTDVLLISYGAGWGSPEGGLIGLQTGANVYAVPGSLGYQTGDRVIVTTASRGTPCNLALTTVIGTPTGSSVTVATGVANAANGVMFNLGREPRFVVYAVRNGRLTSCNLATQNCTSVASENWTEIADNIVSLRAQYARDTSATRDGLTDDFSPDLPTVTTPYCAFVRTVGVRAVLVARSRQPEKTDAPAAAPTWSGSASSPISPPGDDWKQYRYRSFETTVPLRNAPESTATTFSSC